MQRDYFLYHLSYTEFEALVTEICTCWFGNGTTSFTDGRDGGRDAKFNGKAECYPSKAEPWDGNIVIQAKHTTTPNASCSDSDFKKYYLPNKNNKLHGDSEIPKMKKLIQEGILDYYIVFSNRKLTAEMERKIIKQIKIMNLKDAAVIGLDKLNQFLKNNPNVTRKLPTKEYFSPFDFNSEDMVEVIEAVHAEFNTAEFGNTQIDFKLVNKKKVKNELNNLSQEYYDEVLVNKFMPLFDRFKSFLENERNSLFRNMYHDIASELKQQILIHREEFGKFEDIMVHIYKVVEGANSNLKGKRRFVTFLLCYMYFDCDIGKRSPEE